MTFFDGGSDDVPPDHGAPAVIGLQRPAAAQDADSFALLRRIGYVDGELGDLLVPRDLPTFRTDLTSVPSVFAWLVPRVGRHLPAALLHDGLVGPPDDPTYVSVEGHVVDRVQADRVFRDAMATSGVPLIRRWLVWSAVTLATMTWGDVPGRWRRWYQVVPAATLGSIVVLGWCATWDLLDVDAWWAPGVWWIPEGSWPVELAWGAAGAVVVPVLLSVLWGRFYSAGVVLSVGLALLLHVTVAVAALTLLYQVLERVVAAVVPRPPDQRRE
ncbi:DUF1353 domain-containing protein [Nocardioides acrostichi]|uniref:DUF1353 domain-containing protein n=1 Tax=Nocardioides acrostichi TaxID=2784339 RepID=A0A930V1B1_9ACTN|nr:DUF1353 domain-containing protein [Nocardioides acrostichi]MBF4163572.1 DUF1353 domain-containing protein [Nocardioides acrostichi]